MYKLLLCLTLLSMGCVHQRMDCNYAYDIIPADEHAPFPVMEDYALKCQPTKETNAHK